MALTQEQAWREQAEKAAAQGAQEYKWSPPDPRMSVAGGISRANAANIPMECSRPDGLNSRLASVLERVFVARQRVEVASNTFFGHDDTGRDNAVQPAGAVNSTLDLVGMLEQAVGALHTELDRLS